MSFLTDKEISRIDVYKYSCIDNSITARLLQYFWNYALKFVPMRMAPNQVTFIGLLSMLVGFGSVFFYSSQDLEVPAWSWVLAALCMFAYQTLDALDGKQARRISAGSPLGELVDHGCDAVTTVLYQYILCTCVFRHNFYRTAAMSALIYTGFFLALWEHYCSGIFYLGHVSAPTEGLLLTMAMCVLNATLGNSIWTDPARFPNALRSLSFDWRPYAPATFNLNQIPLLVARFNTWEDIYYGIGVTACVFTLTMNVVQVLRLVIKQRFIAKVPPTSPAYRKTLTFGDAILRTLLPTLLVAKVYYDFATTFPEFMHKHFFLIEWAYGFAMANTSTRITISRLLQSKFFPASFGYLIVLFGCGVPVMASIALKSSAASAAFAPFLKPLLQTLVSDNFIRWYFVAAAVIVPIDYILMCRCVFTRLAKHLGIFVFTLTPKQHRHIDTIISMPSKKKD